MRRQALAPILLAGLALQSCGPAPGSAAPPPSPCVVARIGDGDTFTCRDGRKVRLIGVDSPELAQGEPGRQARAALSRLAPPGTSVRLEADVTPRDRYGRELAHVWNGPRLVNEALVLEGWAMLYTVPPNVKYADRLEQAQRKARAARAGMWAAGLDCAPADYRRGKCKAGG